MTNIYFHSYQEANSVETHNQIGLRCCGPNHSLLILLLYQLTQIQACREKKYLKMSSDAQRYKYHYHEKGSYEEFVLAG